MTAATPTLIRRAVWRTGRRECSAVLRALGQGQAGRDGQALGVGRVDGLDAAALQRQAQLLAEMLHEAGDGDRRAGDDAELDGLRRVLRAVEVQRGADAVGELAHALL